MYKAHIYGYDTETKSLMVVVKSLGQTSEFEIPVTKDSTLDSIQKQLEKKLESALSDENAEISEKWTGTTIIVRTSNF